MANQRIAVNKDSVCVCVVIGSRLQSIFSIASFYYYTH